jgi:hypothetical protein
VEKHPLLELVVAQLLDVVVHRITFLPAHAVCATPQN